MIRAGSRRTTEKAALRGRREMKGSEMHWEALPSNQVLVFCSSETGGPLRTKGLSDVLCTRTWQGWQNEVREKEILGVRGSHALELGR